MTQALPTKVLVIDDDDATTEMFKLILEPKQFEVHVVNTGPEGVAAAQRLSPDVIVLDLLMPEMNGTEVCREDPGLQPGADPGALSGEQAGHGGAGAG